MADSLDRSRPETALLLSVALATLALQLASAPGYGFFRDEFYYLACGRRLAWGYVDHPPLIGLVAAFAERALGGSIVAIRLLPALAHAALVFVTGLAAQRLGGGRLAQFTAALAVVIAPVYLASANTLNMNPFDQLLWTLCVLLLIDAAANDRAPHGLAFGVAAGIGLLNKHSFAFFLVATVVAIALSPQRAWFRTRALWTAAAVAAVIVSPNVMWEIRHDWPTLEFLRNAAEHKNYSSTPLEFVMAQWLIMLPVNIVLALAGLAWLVASKRFRAIGLGFAAIVVMLFAMKAKHYYLAPAYPAALAAGAVAFERFLSRARLRWLRPVYLALMIVLGGAIAPLALPVLPPEMYVRYARRLGIEAPRSERHRVPRMSQQFADMFGWEELAAEVARVYRTLPADEQRRCVIYASNYGEAGALEWFGPRYGLPKVVSGHNNYYLWGPPEEAADVVITVGEDSAGVAESFHHVEPGAVFRHEWNMPYESDLPIYIGRGPRRTWREIWPHTKEYI